jgi:predicted metal-dependent hydrolase
MGVKYPELYYKYFDLFNNEEFWEAHEALEELWQPTRDRFLQGLIVFAGSLVHVQRNNPSGCRKLLVKALDFLTPYGARHWDLNLEPIIRHARHCLELLEQRPDGQKLMGYIPFIKLALEPEGLE